MKKILTSISIFLLVIDIRAQIAIPNGYENNSWGSLLSTVKENIKGKTIYTDDKKVIISIDGDVEYQYGFFYIDPALIAPKEKNEKLTAPAPPDQEGGEGKLFFVSLKFPYLALDEILKKFKEKYGEPTTDNVKKSQGAIVWDSQETIIILWVDLYKEKKLCRRATYVGKAYTKQLNEYQLRLFNSTEMDIIQKLNP